MKEHSFQQYRLPLKMQFLHSGRSKSLEPKKVTAEYYVRVRISVLCCVLPAKMGAKTEKDAVSIHYVGEEEWC